MKFNLDYLKKNPWALGAVVIIGALIVWRIWGGAAGAETVSSSGSDPNLLAAQTAITAKQIDANNNIQLASISRDLQIAAIKEQGSATLALAQENNAANIAASRIAASSASEQIAASTSVAVRQIDAQVAADAAQRAVQMAQIDATLEASLASINASAQNTALQTQANVAIAGFARDINMKQSDVQLAMAQGFYSVQKAQSRNSLIGGIVGNVSRIFL